MPCGRGSLTASEEMKGRFCGGRQVGRAGEGTTPSVVSVGLDIQEVVENRKMYVRLLGPHRGPARLGQMTHCKDKMPKL